MAQITITGEDLLRDIYEAEAAQRWFEQKYGLLSETFYRLYQQGLLRDEDPAEIREYLEWSGWCEIYQDRRRRYDESYSNGFVNANFASELTQKLDTLPERPGVYIYRSSDRKVIYVGKAVVLRNRVRSYFQANRDPKTRRLVSEIADLEWIVTDTELEALILENELIKRHRPRFNVRLKDDKTYPYIKLHWNEDFPKVTIVRRMERDGGRYYGPFTSAYAVRQTLDVLRRVFPYLDCTREITGLDPKPCLYYHIKRCAGPCIGAVDREGYRQIIAGLGAFLEGDSEAVLAQLTARMQAAAENLQFERAALLRDQIRAATQIVAAPEGRQRRARG